MMKYGGIYLDNDVYVIKNLDKYRKFESIGNMMILLVSFDVFSNSACIFNFLILF